MPSIVYYWHLLLKVTSSIDNGICFSCRRRITFEKRSWNQYTLSASWNETKWAKQIIAYYTYIPVISNTKLNFISYVGLSWPRFIMFILYQLISSNFRCIEVSHHNKLTKHSVTFHPLDPHAVKSLKLMFEAQHTYSGMKMCGFQDFLLLQQHIPRRIRCLTKSSPTWKR